MCIRDRNWIASTKPIDKIACNAKFRYRQPDNPIQLEFIDEDTVYLTFDKPIKAVTPGPVSYTHLIIYHYQILLF